jgi:hypothetical protein
VSLRWSELELDFLRRVYKFARDVDIAQALGRSRLAVKGERHVQDLVKPDGRGDQRMSAEAVREAWARVQRGERLPPALLAWPHHCTLTGTPGRHSKARISTRNSWIPGDLEKLDSMLGTCPIANMACELGRTDYAIEWELWQCGWMSRHLRYDARGLAHALAGEGKYVSAKTVESWINRKKVRVFRDGRKGGVTIVHRDDAEWLLSNYAYGMWFPPHPGTIDDEVGSTAVSTAVAPASVQAEEQAA